MTVENKVAFYLPEETEAVTSVKETLKMVSNGPSNGPSSDHEDQKKGSDRSSSDSDAVMNDSDDGENVGKHTGGRDCGRAYGRVSMDYFEVAEHGLKTPANENKGNTLSNMIPFLKIVVLVSMALGFLAWY